MYDEEEEYESEGDEDEEGAGSQIQGGGAPDGKVAKGKKGR